jgi:ornithine cyclodeaminase/alanine dehydrogenase-like protein (mu-crystallin family)
MTARNPAATQLQRALRISGEPCEYVTEWQVHHRLTRDSHGYYRFVRRQLEAIAHGETRLELPPKQVFSDADGGDFRVMPCVVHSGDGIYKTVKVIGTNRAQRRVPGQITVGKALALDPDENFVTHVFDGCLLSSARTGLVAGLAIDLLARRQSQLTVIGAGRVGIYSACFAATLTGTRRVTFVDCSETQAELAASALAALMPDVTVRAGTLSTSHSTDIVVLATTSSRPLCAPPGWGADLVISLGADIDDQSELDPGWADVADIYLDTRDSARFGDLRAWLESGKVEESRFVDLFELIAGRTHESMSRPRLFVSTGSALFDNLTIAYLLSMQPR